MDCKLVAGCTRSPNILCETKGGAIINDIVFILKGLTDALITLFFETNLGGAIIDFFELLLTWTWGLGAKVLGNVAEIQNFPTNHQDLSMEKLATRGRRVHLHTLVDR